MAMGDETAGIGGAPRKEPDRDLLAERRARRGEIQGEPAQMPGEQILIRRAEAAEEQAHALEERLAGIQQRLREAERECAQVSERLAQREEELRRSSERMAGGERELGSVSSRLAEREEELRRLSGRLGQREQELRLLSGRLGQRDDDLRLVSERLREREQQLGRLEQEIVERVQALEQRVGEVGRELVGERSARQAAERELMRLASAQRAIEPLIGELKSIARRLRLAAEAPQRPESGPQAAPGPAPESQPAAGAVSQPARAPQAEAGSEQERRAQMTDALAAAVERLRARVAAVGELHSERSELTTAAAGEQPSQPPGAAGDRQAHLAPGAPPGTERAAPSAVQAPASPAPLEYRPPALTGAAEHRPWLALAIRRLAERTDANLAGELVLELLRAHGLAASGPLGYCVRLDEIGSFRLRPGQGGATTVQRSDGEPAGSPTFTLQGEVAAFAEVAGGGVTAGIVRWPAGIRVRGSRRRARRLLAERREPVALSGLARAGLPVWPGLVLAALAEAVDPAWTVSQRFTVQFAIEGAHSAQLCVSAADGDRLRLARAGSEGTQPPPMRPEVTVHLGEIAFLCLLSGESLPSGERVLLQGDRGALERLLAWTDRVQGIRRFGA